MAYIHIGYQLTQETVDNINNIIKNEEFEHDFESWAHVMLSHIHHIADPNDTYMYIGALPTDATDMKSAIYNRLIDDGIDIMSSVGNSISILNGPTIYFTTIPEVAAVGISDAITKYFLDFNIQFPEVVIEDVLLECWDQAADRLGVEDVFLGLKYDEVYKFIN